MRFKDELDRQLYYRVQIDYCYWMIQQISKHNAEIQSPLNAMIDRATGFDKAIVKSRIKDVKYCMSVVIRCKEKLGYDTKKDKSFLIEIKKLV